MTVKQTRDVSSIIVAVVAIIGLVVLNMTTENVPETVNLGLIGSALGASIEDIRKWKKK